MRKAAQQRVEQDLRGGRAEELLETLARTVGERAAALEDIQTQTTSAWHVLNTERAENRYRRALNVRPHLVRLAHYVSAKIVGLEDPLKPRERRLLIVVLNNLWAEAEAQRIGCRHARKFASAEHRYCFVCGATEVVRLDRVADVYICAACAALADAAEDDDPWS